MLVIKPVESLDQLNNLKKAYFESLTAPLDGMWHFGFVPMAKHFGFYKDDVLVGFCCINDDLYILQFYLEPNSQSYSQELFSLIAEQKSPILGAVKGAIVSTAESFCMSLCLDRTFAYKVNALMYQYSATVETDVNESIQMDVATSVQLAEFVQFAVTNIGAPEQWLNSYYGNLINRNELFGYWRNQQLIAAGECRLFDEHQTNYADLGLIVAKTVRNEGVGRKVLNYLVTHAIDKKLMPICSTESNNKSAQKAIVQAGFVSSDRIVQFEFTQAK